MVTTHTVFFSRSAAGHVLLRICRCVECATLNENCGAPSGETPTEARGSADPITAARRSPR